MTITPTDIYLVSFADRFINLAIGLATAAAIVLVFGIIGFMLCSESCDEEGEQKAKKIVKISAKVIIPCALVITLTPNSKTIAAMCIIPAVVNNEHIQNSAGNALGVLEELTKQWLRDAAKDNASKQKEAHI